MLVRHLPEHEAPKDDADDDVHIPAGGNRFSADGNNAPRRAALLAHEHGAGLHILHVLKAAGCKPLRDWFSPTIDIDLRAAQAREALRLGGTVDRMLRTCRRPVLVVKTPVTQPYRRILVPIDFTASSDAAIEVAARLRRGAGMHRFHAFESQRDAVLREAGVPEHIIRETRLMEEAGINARMRRKVAELGLDGMSMSFVPTQGPAVPSTLRHAQAIGADLACPTWWLAGAAGASAQAHADRAAGVHQGIRIRAGRPTPGLTRINRPRPAAAHTGSP